MSREDELQQADLSHLDLKDMTPAQRAEIKRRFETFVAGISGREEPAAVKPKVRKWTPGMKASK